MDNNSIEYLNEHLWVGHLGRGLVYISVVSALLATLAYAFGARKQLEEQGSWRSLGRQAFTIHGISVFGIIGLIFYMMISRMYEYEYVWSHVSNDLPFQYIFSAFWEGQEGSFLLWMGWHVVLGFLLLWRAKSWELPVMATMSFAQFCLATMLIGFYLGEGDARIGSNPFVLLRDMHFAPRFNVANYLEGLNGTGLNPLLQNYWMTIHPPTLFLGFASTIVPFAYAVAGLWQGRHIEWIKASMPWALFSAAILGTGILMGGAWAYEALSFGGYWAWDPVENASLVPWITLVAGIHTALIARNTGHAIRATYVFYLITFILIVYSTFLTRSGILGESSAHAFTEMGLEWQLVLFIFAVILWGFVPYFAKRKTVPVSEKEESAYSKEFWLFTGSLVLLFSAVLITFTTSIPVFKALATGLAGTILGMDVEAASAGEHGDTWKFLLNLAPPEDVVDHHNRFQLWIGVLVGLMSGTVHFLRYKVEEIKPKFARFLALHLGGAAALSLLLTLPIMYSSGIQAWQYWVLVFCGIFAVASNLDFLITVLRGRFAASGSSLAHIGFGLMLVGVVFSGALKKPISEGFTSIDDALGGLNKQSNKNVLLAKGKATQIRDNYTATYTDDWPEGNMQIFRLAFVQKDAQGNMIDSFSTYPNVLRTQLPSGFFKFDAANPNTKHYISKDIFTLAVPHWAFEDPEEEAKQRDSIQWSSHQVAEGDTIFTKSFYVIFEGFEKENVSHPDYQPEEGDLAVAARLAIHRVDSGLLRVALPLFYIRGNMQFDLIDEHKDLGLKLRLARILPQENKVLVEVFDDKPDQPYVIMQALVFPGINLVWLGTILMMTGLTIAIFQRIQKPPKQQV